MIAEAERKNPGRPSPFHAPKWPHGVKRVRSALNLIPAPWSVDQPMIRVRAHQDCRQTNFTKSELSSRLERLIPA